jgi:hypothetical protein
MQKILGSLRATPTVAVLMGPCRCPQARSGATRSHRGGERRTRGSSRQPA